MARTVYENIGIIAEQKEKLRGASKVTRIPQTQILRQLIDAHLDAWVRDFFNRNEIEPGAVR